jgi:plasmid stability protein
MATIQVRNVPEGVHRVYQTRAAAAGMSVQEYLLAELERNAALRTPAELVAETELRLRSEGPEGFAPTAAARIVCADRASH